MAYSDERIAANRKIKGVKMKKMIIFCTFVD